MTTKAYVRRIIECVELMVKDGVVSSAEDFRIKYGLPTINEEALSNESEESINKIIEALSDKNPASRVYIQTGSRSKIVDVNPIQLGHGNLVGNNNRTKESSAEEDCPTKLIKALEEIKYLKKALDDQKQVNEDKDKEIERLNTLISELVKKIK